MAPIAGSTGLPYLTQPGGLLSNLPAPISASSLQTAAPQDLVSLSAAALQSQEVAGLLGISPNAQSAGLVLPVSTSAETGGVLPGVSSADLSSATPQEQALVNDQALLLQQVQGLLGQPNTTTGALNVIA